jgi:HSP20 family protein
MSCCNNNQEIQTCSNNQTQQEIATLTKTITMSPKMQYGENDKNYVIYAELPGVNQEHVHLTLDKNVLTLLATQIISVTSDFKHVLGAGLPVTFQRKVILPEDIDRDGLKAVIKDGLLKIEILKKPEVATAKITVLAG